MYLFTVQLKGVQRLHKKHLALAYLLNEGILMFHYKLAKKGIPSLHTGMSKLIKVRAFLMILPKHFVLAFSRH